MQCLGLVSLASPCIPVKCNVAGSQFGCAGTFATTELSAIQVVYTYDDPF